MSPEDVSRRDLERLILPMMELISGQKSHPGVALAALSTLLVAIAATLGFSRDQVMDLVSRYYDAEVARRGVDAG